jgi:beta-phosphoglucomutase-like phosphatase (HAD superfamily)
MTTALKALIFDVDGTLADTERDGHRPAFNRAFAEAGLGWHWDEALYGELLAVTGGKERIRHYLARIDPAQLAAPGTPALIEWLYHAKTAHFAARVREGRLPLRPGIERLIALARSSGLRLAIATTTAPENVGALLEFSLGKGSEQWFDCIGAGDVVPAKKPAPDIYEWVLARLGLAASECLAFEDSENGLRAALGAGLATVVTTNGYTQKQSFDGAAVVTPALDDSTTLDQLHRWHRSGSRAYSLAAGCP